MIISLELIFKTSTYENTQQESAQPKIEIHKLCLQIAVLCWEHHLSLEFWVYLRFVKANVISQLKHG